MTNRILRTFAFMLCALMALPAFSAARALDGGEFMIDTGTAGRAPAPGERDNPGAAFDGTNYLAVWHDTRYPYGIYAARVDTQGNVLDPAGFAVSPFGSNATSPAVASDSSGSLVVWEDHRGPGGNADVYAARVSPQGHVIDSTGFPVSRALHDQIMPGVAFDGTNYLVAWGDNRWDTGSCIYAARVTPQGTVLDPNGIEVSLPGPDTYPRRPGVAFNGTNYVIVWQGKKEGDPFWPYPYAARVSTQGVLLDSTPIHLAGNSGYAHGGPSVASDGANCLVTWSGGGEFGIRVTPEGSLLDSTPIRTRTVCLGLAFDGIDYVATGTGGNMTEMDIYGTRISRQGVVLDTGFKICEIPMGNVPVPEMASAGVNSLAIWDEMPDSGQNITAARITQQGVVLDTVGIIVTKPPYDAQSAAAASDSTNYLVAWQDFRDYPQCRIYGARVAPDGSVLSPGVIPIARAASDQQAPAVAFDGTDYLVAWQDHRNDTSFDIYATRLSVEGTVLDSPGIAVSLAGGNQTTPAVGFDGTRFMIAWQDGRHGYGIYAARVTGEGVVLDSLGIAVNTTTIIPQTPTLAFDGADYLVVWSAGYSGSTTIFGARVTPGGNVLDTARIDISTEGGDDMNPAVIYDGANFLVAWYDAYVHDIYAARVNSQGILVDTTQIPVCKQLTVQTYPALCLDGARTLVAWQDDRNGAGYDIYRAHISRAGVVSDADAAVAGPGDQLGPALALGQGGQVFLAYQGWIGSADGNVFNTDRIWGKVGSFTGIHDRAPLTASRQSLTATIARGVLTMPLAAYRLPLTAALLDISGRKVLDLHAGANDVTRLASGVYFVREKPQPIWKVELTK